MSGCYFQATEKENAGAESKMKMAEIPNKLV